MVQGLAGMRDPATARIRAGWSEVSQDSGFRVWMMGNLTLGIGRPKGIGSPWYAWTWGLPGMEVPDMS